MILGGDRNNAYFHGLANQRHRSNHLDVLVGENGPVYYTSEMLEVATSFYKKLFGFEHRDNVHLGRDFRSAQDLVPLSPPTASADDAGSSTAWDIPSFSGSTMISFTDTTRSRALL